MTKAAIYARISQSDPKVEKTVDQESRCRALAEYEGYEVVAVFVDDGISAFTGKARPGWLGLVDGIAAKDFDVVLAVAEDRLARDSQEKIGFQVHCARSGATWHTLAGGKVDPSTAAGSLMSTITGAMAQYESHVKRERVLASVERRLREGKDLGGPRPFGFEKDGRTIRLAEAAVLRQAYDVLLQEGSVYAVTVFLNRSGMKTLYGKEWGWTTVRKMLARKRNIGVLEHKGVEISRPFPPLVSEETFEAAQLLMAGFEPVARGPKPAALASGILLCGRCGQTMTNGGVYYRCSYKYGTAAEGRSARDRDAMHPTATRQMVDGLIRERTFIRLVELDGEPAAVGVAETSDVVALRVAVAEAGRRRDVAQELAFMPGANMALLGRQMAAIQAEVDGLNERLQAALQVDTRSSIRALAREGLVELADGVAALDGPAAYATWLPRFTALPLERQRSVVTSLFSSITVAVGGRGPRRIGFDWPGRVESTLEKVSLQPF